ncbi:putative E3 ubiquitin-protein ligase [Clavispora lusitaniae]|uniref:Uncharacterized protein n=2 Tax=Clavispora lusitaniae TaxID=36911 RepID=A0AA91T435_CLALS|nr:hypothetical protein E0198_003282 [Clavispora lusitaniae]KAF7582496.1 hypothetical protein FOB63_002577 [Clavispora lusitaniae]OVF11043.1 hypothetical protein A9F13_01g04939 [Clavispora lusitaniae]QFZ28424.1 putative E3 ubiquitin-protein ligase [Clavispora lusitaniae]QFZ34087.1 putative E3 ubiquitin-protein ligase [Clavispora lusitaniae]
MAATLKPDPALQRFNAAKESQGHFFRFKTKSALFNVLVMGIVPAGLAYFAYSKEGQYPFSRVFRKEVVLEEEYVPRKKDL